MMAIGLIDVQNDFIFKEGALYVPKAENGLRHWPALIELGDKWDIPVFFTADNHYEEDLELLNNGGQFPSHCMKGTLGQRVILNTDGHHVFNKRCYDVFDSKLGNPKIIEWLYDMNIEHVMLAGLVGNICVQACALGLKKLGIDVTIIDEATVWMDIDDKNNKRESIRVMLEAGVKFTCLDKYAKIK
jgi:nicotinamidase/pyrazinamidase